jgi:hypothetical protein
MKRRRVIIVSLVLLAGIAACLGWRLTHGHDPRFVGRWRVDDSSESSGHENRIGPAQRAQTRQMTFNADGTALLTTQTWVSPGPVHGAAPFEWWTCGDRLYTRRPAESRLQSARAAVDDAIYMLMRRRGRIPIEATQVIDRSDREVRLRPLTGLWLVPDPVVVLTRYDQ